MKTLPGGIATALILVVILFYAINTLIKLVNKEQPFIKEIEIPEYYSIDYKKNLTKLGSKIAFTVEDYFDEEARLDARYIKTLVRISGKKNGEKYVRFLNYHKCTETELAQFPEIEA